MNTKKLFLKTVSLICAALIFAAFTACENPVDEKSGETGRTYNDTPLASASGLAGTLWTDYQEPESTIEFTSAASVTLTGRYWNKKLEINGGQHQINLSGPKTYEAAGNFSGAGVEPAVWILTDGTNRKGIELYYYKADASTGKHQRLVVYATGILQPREFYLP
jgi:hypothetical protein